MAAIEHRVAALMRPQSASQRFDLAPERRCRSHRAQQRDTQLGPRPRVELRVTAQVAKYRGPAEQDLLTSGPAATSARPSGSGTAFPRPVPVVLPSPDALDVDA